MTDLPSWDPSADQAAAMKSIKNWLDSNPRDYLTLGGFAGTGKTFLLGRLCLELDQQGRNFAIASPTGRAAQVLTESLLNAGVENPCVTTIHGLIYIPKTDEATGRITGWIRRPKLDTDLIIIDEASMVSRKMFKDLQVFGVPILAVGDHGQLPPVGEEPFLMRNPRIKLTRIHRQARGNPVIRLSTIIRNGAPNEAIKALMDDLGDDRIQYTTSADLGRKFGQPPGMVITYTNSLRTTLNNDIREELHGLHSFEPPKEGEVVICLKNHRLHEEGASFLANGMRGIVLSCRDHEKNPNQYVMDLEMDPPIGKVEGIPVSKHQFLKDKTFKGFDQVPGDHRGWWSVGALFDFGYAITGHKSVLENTLLYTDAGVSKKIKDFKSGDKIKCVDNGGNIVTTEVVDVHDHGYLEGFEVEFDDGYSIGCSADHKFLTDHGQIPLHEIVSKGLEVLCAEKESRWMEHTLRSELSEQTKDGVPPQKLQPVQNPLKRGDATEENQTKNNTLWYTVGNEKSIRPSIELRGMPVVSRASPKKRGLGNQVRPNYIDASDEGESSQGHRISSGQTFLHPGKGRYAKQRSSKAESVLSSLIWVLLLDQYRMFTSQMEAVADSHAPLRSTGDLVRRKVVRIRPLGIRRMYDLEVSHPKHNFLLPNGVVTSNSQGGSADNVAIFMENWLLRKIGERDAARWLYTCVTRSRDKVLIVF